jgi:hypothetical protein
MQWSVHSAVMADSRGKPGRDSRVRRTEVAVLGRVAAGAALLLSTVLTPLASQTTVSPALLEFVQSSLRHHPVVFLGDVHPLAEPKLLVSSLIRGQREDQGIDLLVLEVASEQQQWIDRYLASEPEDTGILLDHPRTLRGHWGVSAEYLEIYQTVYQWNAEHPARRVEILAADLTGWPLPAATAHGAIEAFARRDKWMATSLQKKLQPHPDWRVLIFMGGYHGLKAIGGQVTLGQAYQRLEYWFAGYLLERGTKVFSILSDARQPEGHGATRVFERLAGRSRENFAQALDSTTDAVTEPIYRVDQESFRLEFSPSHFPLQRAVDAMIILNRATPITLLRRDA